TATSGTVFAVFSLRAYSSYGIILASSDEATTSYFQLVAATNAIGSNAHQPYVGRSNPDTYVAGETYVYLETPYLGIWESDGTGYAIRICGDDKTMTAITGSDSGDWFGD